LQHLLLLLLLPVLSGLKRHSVTLFEGGRVGGAAVMDELITELAASAAAGEFFEGDMVQVSRGAALKRSYFQQEVPYYLLMF
jgi:F0F1-type ATP synthase beta subunit